MTIYDRKYMRRGSSGFGGGGSGLSFSFPPFTKAVKWLVIVNVAVFLVTALLESVAPYAYGWTMAVFGLVPLAVVHGYLYQLVSYSFLHQNIWHILFNMLSLWFIGAYLEMDWKAKRFLEFYFFCVVGAALTTVGLAYTGIHQIQPDTITIGASGGIYGVLVAFGMLYGEMEMFLFPLPFSIKAKYVAAIWILIAIAGSVAGGGHVAYFGHLGGVFFGYGYVKWLRRRGGLAAAFPSPWAALRDRYYRWQRRRAARKFQLYMRKQGQEQSYLFDEHGNYIGPDAAPKKDDDPKRPWVN
ncbi:MAG TPA: rhomboid family intramembrane serine protease [Terriglobales bacterium]|nr:rhomboid family intramembrane serine protease [Terriglobales bacterium]